MRRTWAEINLQNLTHNFKQVRELVGDDVAILSVVKADAYGHGAVEVSRTLIDAGTEMLGVATVDEALELRDYGAEVPIFLLGGIHPDEVKPVVEHDLTPFLYSIEAARALDREAHKACKKAHYHLKFDTGMTRLGVRPNETLGYLDELLSFENIVMDGVVTHLSNAFIDNDEHTNKQIGIFNELVHMICGKGFTPKYIHTANSAAIQKYPQSHNNLVRPGIMLYGFGNYSGLDLRPVMTLKSRILQLSSVPSATPVSYGGKFVTKRDSVIATVPVGYADGYARSLSNKAHISVRGVLAPVTGDVCMDFVMTDVTDVPGITVGDVVTLFGDSLISVIDLAQIAGTISYEILSNTGKRVPRKYV